MPRLILPTVACLINLTFVALISPLAAQEKKNFEKPPEGDTTSLIPSSIKDYEIELNIGDKKLPVRVQYAVQGQTIFVLPVWVAGSVERIVDGKARSCKPDERVLPSDEKRIVRLSVGVRNLLETPEIEKVIIEKLRQRVLDQQDLDKSTKFRIERPNINSTGIRFNLIGPGRGDDTSPAEIAIANPVSRASDDKLIFTLDPTAIRKIETDRSLPAGLALAALNILPTGPMKVRFERLEMDAQVKYLRATLDDFRKRVGSAVNPSGALAPEVIIPLANNGTAETRNQLRSMLVQSLQVTVSTRQGVAELPLMPFLEKAVDSMIETSKVDMQNDQQRATFLLENQVTITATLGEIKKLSKLDEKGRAEAFQKASDHYYATRRGESSNYSGSLNVGFKLFSGGISGSYSNSSTDHNENRTKEEMAQQKSAFDKLMQEFEGKMPTVSGIQVDDQTLANSTKQAETRFQQNSFFVDYTLHRFHSVKLSGLTASGLSLVDLLRDYAILKNEYESMQKLLGTPAQLAEAKANMEKLGKLNADLQARLVDAEKALARFEKDATNSLAKVDAHVVSRLQKELARLRRNVGVDFANHIERFQNLEADERPPGLDCTGPNGADSDVVRESQIAWAKYLGEMRHEKTMYLDREKKVAIEMVLIPPGKYYRGEGNEAKVITLTKPLWVGKYEVTQKQYEVVIGRNPSKFKKEGLEAYLYPVEQVSHDECVKFTNATAGGFRLLSESEWEYAYRAGTRTKWYNGNDKKNLGEIAQFNGNNATSTTRTGGKKPNAFGLYDIAGNVWEWCSDWFADDYDSARTDPQGCRSGTRRVLRGGGWLDINGDAGCFAAYRGKQSPTDRSEAYGFRVSQVPSGW